MIIISTWERRKETLPWKVWKHMSAEKNVWRIMIIISTRERRKETLPWKVWVAILEKALSNKRPVRGDLESEGKRKCLLRKLQIEVGILRRSTSELDHFWLQLIWEPLAWIAAIPTSRVQLWPNSLKTALLREEKINATKTKTGKSFQFLEKNKCHCWWKPKPKQANITNFWGKKVNFAHTASPIREVAGRGEEKWDQVYN